MLLLYGICAFVNSFNREKEDMMDSVNISTRNDSGLEYKYLDAPQAGEVREICQGILWVRLPLFKKLIEFFNAWLLRDTDGWVVVDTGINNDITRSVWEEVLKQYLEGLPIKKVICTHMHPDHTGLAGWFVDNHHATFHMTHLEYLMVRILGDDTQTTAPKEAVQFMATLCSDKDYLKEYAENYGHFTKVMYRIPQSYKRLRDGDIVDIGGKEWEIVVGSGHSPEHACLYCAELKLFISGDQVLPKITSHVGAFFTEPEVNNMENWLKTCRMLPQRVPNDVLVLPAHNEPFYGLHQRVRHLEYLTTENLEKLLILCQTPRFINDDDVFKMLFNRKISRGSFLLAVTESLSHFNCLWSRGKIDKFTHDNGMIYFQKR